MRLKQSPIRQGDGFTSFAMTGIVGRWLHFVRHDRYRSGDGFVVLLLMTSFEQHFVKMPARRHCEGAFFATEAISNTTGRWVHMFAMIVTINSNLAIKDE